MCPIFSKVTPNGLSKWSPLLAGWVLLACAVRGQEPGDQARRVFPDSERPAPAELRRLREKLSLELRALRASAPADRDRKRRELTRDATAMRGLLLDELAERQDHFMQAQILLALLEMDWPPGPPSVVIQDLVAGRSRGEPGLAALVLGTSESAEAFAALAGLFLRGKKPERVHAAVALGRLGDPRARALLERQLPESRGQVAEAVLLGLALAGGPEDVAGLRAYSSGAESGVERLRRAATLAWAARRRPQDAPELLRLAADDDRQVRRIAIEGLGLLPPEEARFVAALGATRLKATDEVLRGRLLLLAGRSGGKLAREALATGTRSEDPRQRAAAASGLLMLGGAAARDLRVSWLSDPDPRVKIQGILATADIALRDGLEVDLLAFARDPQERVREAAMYAHVLVQGRAGARKLVALTEPTWKDDVRELARELLDELAFDGDGARSLAWATLQCRWDDAETALSWNLSASVAGHLLELFEIEDAKGRGGGGDAPTGVSGAARAEGAVIRAARQSAVAEDLVRHFEHHPYVLRFGPPELARPR